VRPIAEGSAVCFYSRDIFQKILSHFICLLPSSSPRLKMTHREQRPAFRNGDVVYGVGGAFFKKLGMVKKMNAVKPTIQDSKGRCSSFGVLNLKKVGRAGARFGHCSACKKPSQYALPCTHGASGGKACSGTILGNLSWKLESLSPLPDADIFRPPPESNARSTALLLASQLGATLKHMGFSGGSRRSPRSNSRGLLNSSTSYQNSDRSAQAQRSRFFFL